MMHGRKSIQEKDLKITKRCTVENVNATMQKVQKFKK